MRQLEISHLLLILLLLVLVLLHYDAIAIAIVEWRMLCMMSLHASCLMLLCMSALTLRLPHHLSAVFVGRGTIHAHSMRLQTDTQNPLQRNWYKYLIQIQIPNCLLSTRCLTVGIQYLFIDCRKATTKIQNKESKSKIERF